MAATSAADITQVLAAVGSNYPGIHTGLTTFSILFGAYYVAIGTYHLATHHAQARLGNSAAGGVYELLAGAALSALPTAMAHGSESVFGTADGLRTALDYSSPAGSQAAAMFTILIGFITLYGWYAVIRGWMTLTKLAKPGQASDGAFGHALVFLISGTICANFLVFTDTLAASFGVENFLRNYIPG